MRYGLAETAVGSGVTGSSETAVGLATAQEKKEVTRVENSGLSSLIFLALLIVVFYFMLIRPQKRRVEQHRRLIESLGEGDEIVTIGGLYGRITRMGSEDIDLDVGGGTRLRFIKSAIARKVEEPGADDSSSVGDTGEGAAG